ncbi:MAG: ABC transporter permease [Acidobacteria bacterium]|nr:ABC transporter permease [Acidobacteriota bacterium]
MHLLRDLRLILRQLRRAPGYVAMVVLTLALAIGANSAVFSAVKSVLLRPLSVARPDQTMVVWQTDNASGKAVIELTLRHLREWTADRSVFLQAAVMGSHNWNAVYDSGSGDSVRIFFSGVSAGFFETLGAVPLLGRTLRAEDDLPNAAAVLVLSHATWIRRFGGDRDIVGRTMSLDGQPVEIVGVMPEGFDVPRGAEFWTPVTPILGGGAASSATTLQNVINNVGVFYLVGRVRSGVTAAEAARLVDALDMRLQRDVPGRPTWGDRAVVTPLVEHVFGPVRPTLWALWTAVTVLLLIACANVSGLTLSRAAMRRREEAVRLAIGATRVAIGRLWVLEVFVLSAAGGAIGLAAAGYLARAIAALAPDDVPGVERISIDAGVALFTLAVVAVVAVATTALPMRTSYRVSLAEIISGGDRSTTGRQSVRARSVLLVLQVALSVALLVAAGLVVRSFVNLRRIDLGFQPANVLAMTVQPRSIQGSPTEWYHELIGRIAQVPGVEAAGVVYLRPLQLGPIGDGIRVWLEGQPETDAAAAANPTLNYQIATPGYFEAMRIPMIRGRGFTDADRAGTDRVVLVSEATAQALWPGRDPIGRRVLMSSFVPGQPPRAWRTVVGVVKNVRYRGLDEVQLDIYDPALQVGRQPQTIVVRTATSPIGALPSIQAQARALDPTAVIDDVVTMDAVVARAVAPWRLSMWMFVLFAVVAFGLALTGLVSVVALDVAHRRHEFAIRLALGATAAAILHAALRRTAWRVSLGVAMGMFGAALGARALRSLLYGVAATDPATFGGVTAFTIGAAALAAYIPGRRASRAEVNALLRHT